MSDTAEHSDIRRVLLEKYLQEKRLHLAGDTSIVPECNQETENVGSRARLTTIQIGSSKRPFFFLHGHPSGTAFYCYPLAASLGSDQPFYALEPYSFDGLQIPPKIEDIAAAHVKEMRIVQPEGPYLLGGFCNGALVAYEMARQLDVEGQPVDLLVLMDPMALRHTLPIYLRLLRWLTNHLGDRHKQLDWFVQLRHMVRESYNYLRSLVPWGWGNAEDLGTDGAVEPVERPKIGRFALPRIDSIIPTHEAIHKDYDAIVEWLVLDYRPTSVYPSKITFFWAKEATWHIRWWNQVAKAVEVEEYFIPGTQITWKTRYIRDLSACLQECFSRMRNTAASHEE
ncbi:MAG: thioesterase domain-containing protein [Chloroflexota bacterium]|nr:thioesterase domain-containing protein [Chloroflexota bacterium]